MAKLHDLSGQRFGRVVVIRREGTYRPRRNPYQSQPTYLCLCDCGTEFITSAPNLKFGRTRSCGCLRSEIAKENAKKRRERNGKAVRHDAAVAGPAR